MMRRLLLLCVLCVLLCIYPSQSQDSTSASPDTTTATGTSASTDTSTASNPGTDTSTASNPGTDTSTASNSGTDTSTASNSGTDTSTASNPNTDTSTASNSGTDTSTASNPGTDTSTASNSGTDTSTDSSSSTETSVAAGPSIDTSTASSSSTDTNTVSSPSTDTSTASNSGTDTSTASNSSTDTSTDSSSSTDTSTWSTDNSSVTNTTDNFSTSTAPSTTTTPATTTIKPTFDLAHQTDAALFILTLNVSSENATDIQYTTNLTREEILRNLNTYFQSFSLWVDLQDSEDAVAEMSYRLRIAFLYKLLTNDTNSKLEDALNSIQNLPDFYLPNANATFETVYTFLSLTSDICNAKYVCPLGFNCNIEGCKHMCLPDSCNNHGVCYVDVSPEEKVQTMCQCSSEYDIEYTGDSCEYSRRGRLQIIAIIAGVLGTACLIFLIIIIVMCVRKRGKSSSNYDFSRANYSNSAYDNAYDK